MCGCGWGGAAKNRYFFVILGVRKFKKDLKKNEKWEG